MTSIPLYSIQMAVSRTTGSITVLSWLVQVTTEAVGRYSPAEQMALVRELRPEAVSLALRELCPEAADEAAFGEFCRWMRESGVWPQFILYDQEDVQRFDAMRTGGTRMLSRARWLTWIPFWTLRIRVLFRGQ